MGDAGALPLLNDVSTQAILYRALVLKFRVPLLLLLLIGILLPTFYFLVKSPTFQFFGGLTSRVDTTDKRVALTFDDGPTPGDTEVILAILKDLNIPATFFLMGTDMHTYPKEAQMIAKAGHQIGNHTYSHQRMVFTPLQQVDSEVSRTNALIRQAGYTGEIYFRPPYGKKFLTLPYYLKQHGIHTVTWDVAPEYGTEETTEVLTEKVLAQVRPGSIILLHPMNGRHQTQAALKPVVQGLQQRGYSFVTVSDLLRNAAK